MRTLILFLLAIGFLTAGVYYQNDGQIPFLALNNNATSTIATTTTEKVGVIDRILNLLHGNKKELEIQSADLTDKTNETTGPNVDTAIGANNETDNANQSPVSINTLAADIQNQLNQLAEDVEEYTEQQNTSPYANQITLQIGGAKATNPEQEYLILKANTNNPTAINISGWKLISSVTKQSVTIPDGNQLLSSVTDRQTSAINLVPGETAYVTSGHNPLRVSFRENDCSGYLQHEGSFTPALGNYCPLPTDELLQFGGSNNDNAKCTEYVSKISRCAELNDSVVAQADISGSCEKFILDTLNYKGCVTKHATETTYLGQGTWRIFLNRNGELWRSTKETIQLADEGGRVVSTLEY